MVITGLSGSGKSSLAFDTIYAEGQRRYVESLSAYARQFLEQMEKPDVDLIDGLSPAISIEQKTTGSNPRSTVGTVTEIYDYLRLLFANIGVPHCPNCDREISSQSLERIIDHGDALSAGRARSTCWRRSSAAGRASSRRSWRRCARAGSRRARIDGQFVRARRRHQARSAHATTRSTCSSIGSSSSRASSAGCRIRSSSRCKLADDIVVINTLDGGDRLFSRRLACPTCGISIPEMTPRAFSFNSPHGACQDCQGLGAVYDFDPARIVPDDTLSLAAGAIAPWAQGRSPLHRRRCSPACSRRSAIDPADAVRQAAEEAARHRALRRARAGGSADEPAAKPRKDPFGADFEGVVPNLRRRFEEGTWTDQEALEPYRALQPCPVVRGRAAAAREPRRPREGPPPHRVS